MMKLTAALAGSVMLASCAPTGEPATTFGAASEDTPVRVTGENRRCLRTTAIRSSKVRDDRTIDFETSGGQVYRNTLDRPCPGLKRRDSFTYRTSLSQLCQGEIIYTLEDYGGELGRGAGCGIGEFQPIEYLESLSNGPMTMDD